MPTRRCSSTRARSSSSRPRWSPRKEHAKKYLHLVGESLVRGKTPNYLDLYPEVEVGDAERKAFAETRTGALVGEVIAQRFKWKVGDRVPLQSTIFPDREGSKNWQFDIVGIMHAKDKKSGGFFDQM